MLDYPIGRRRFLGVGGALVGSMFLPRLASAEGRDPRFISIVLRGALDGLAAVAPLGDPAYEAARKAMVLSMDGPHPPIPLDGFFALNPRMPCLGRLFASGEALLVHAVASPYRGRSHFDGQDVLESGAPGTGQTESGWLNRVIGALPRGDRIGIEGLALGADVPLIMRGPAPVATMLPPGFRAAPQDTRDRLLDLYRHTDPLLESRLAEAIELDEQLGGDTGRRALDAEGSGETNPQMRVFRAAGASAGRLMSKPEGPRVGAISFVGWDTHASEGPIGGRLGGLLAALDQAIDGLHDELKPVWRDVVIVVTTEFGRTVLMNNSAGTDHGIASVAFVLGGAVEGGRVLTDWPGLTTPALYDGRDLMPTTDLRAVLGGVLADHLGLPRQTLASDIFPGTSDLKPIQGLLR
jgi:uncharacterized protein (DUF1501 family)